MGKALRQEHITYFTARMDEHDRVVNWEPIANEYDFLFRIRRTLDGSRSDVIAHLTDAYRYGLAEFFARPNPLGAGSFVVMGMPHADADPEVVEIAKKHRIGIGHSSGPHHQDSGEAKIRESTAGVSRKPSSDGKARGSSR